MHLLPVYKWFLRPSCCFPPFQTESSSNSNCVSLSSGLFWLVGGINTSRFLHQTTSAFWGPAPNSSPHLPVRLLWEGAALRLRTREGAALTEAFKAADMFLYPSPRSAPPDKPVWEICKTSPLTSRLACALTCTVNMGPYIDRREPFPNHVQSTEFTTDGVQWSCRNIWRMIRGNQHLSSIFGFHV